MINSADPLAGPEITIAAGTTPVTEGTPASFTLTASPAPTGSLPVSVTVTDATGADFIASSAEGGDTVTMTGATYAYSIATTADGNDEPSGPVTVTVNAGTGYTVGTNASASVEVEDNDATRVTLTGPAGDRTEGGTKGLSLTLNRPLVSGETLTAPLTFGTGAGTATRGTDYTLACASAASVACSNLNSGSAQVVFTGPSAASVAITLTAATDSLTEGGEEVDIDLGTVTATGLDGGVTQTDNLASFDIDDPGVVTVSPTAVSVVEGSNATGTYTVVLGSDPGASVRVTATSGNAAAQVRRLGTGSWGSSVTLTFTGGNGGNWATAQTVAVRAPSDSNTANETVTVSHAAAVNSNTDNPFHGTDVADVTVNVTDADGLATVQFASPSVASVNEHVSSGNIVITVTKTGNAAAAVEYTTEDNTAEAGSDYTARSGTLTWGANDTTSRTITVPILNDTAPEPSESFHVHLSPASGTPTVIGARNTFTATLQDNDLGGELTVQGFGSTANVDEGGTATFRVSVSRRNPGGFRIPLRVVAGGAGTAGTADATIVDGWVRITPSRQSADATVNILPDTLAEGAETLTVEVHSLPTGFTLADGDDGRDDIIINDVPSVNLSVSASGEVTEGGTLTITATRSVANGSGSALSIPIRVKAADTTAQAADYTLSATSISIANNATTGTATFTAVDDSGDEPPETVTIEIGTPPAGTVKGPDGEVEIAIADGDPTVVSLDRVGAGAVTEGNDIEFTVSIPRALVAGETIDVPLSIGGAPPAEWSLALKSGGSLNTGVTLSGESTATPQVRLSGAGAQTATLLLTATDDSTADDGETWTIALGPDGSGTNGFDRSSLGTDVGGGANPHGSRNSFNVQVDDPAVTPGIAVSESTLALTEGHATDSEKTYTVRLATDPGTGVTVTVTPTSGDTGAATVTPASLAFTGGGSGTWRNAGTFTVSAEADGDTTNETLSVTHAATAPSGNAYRGITVDSVAVTVTDAGNGVIVSPRTLDVRQNNGEAQYTVRLRSAPGGTVTLTPATSDATHVGLSGSTVSFDNTDWSTPKPVTVYGGDSITSDVGDTATITTPITTGTTAYPTGTNVPSVTVTLTADPRPVATLAGGAAVTEGAAAQFTVTLNPAPGSGATSTAVVVTAAQGSNYVAPGNRNAPRLLTVDDSGTETFTVATVNRPADEPNGRVTTLLGGRDHYQVGSPSQAHTTVIDSDPTTVTLARDGTGAISEAAATATVTVTLGRALGVVGGTAETVTVPLDVTGTGITGGDYSLALSTASGLNDGVSLVTSAPHSAAEPAVVFTGHATDTVQTATLILTATDDSDDEGTSETLTVGFDSASNRRVTSNLDRASGTGTGGTTTAGTAVVEINDNDADTTAPTLSSAVVTGASLVLTYDEPLDTTSTPAASVYTVTVGGTNRSVSTVTVSGSTVTLVLASAVTSTQTVTLSYAAPNANPIQDAAGNEAANLTGQTVTNNTAGVPVVSVTLPNVEGVVRNTAGAQVRPEAQATATFNVSAAPAPTGSLTVCVQVTESDEPGAGDRVAAGVEGIRTVTLTGAAGEHAVAWTDDSTDERDSGVTVTAVAPETAGCSATNGSYTVSTTDADDSILIRDDDPTRVSLTSTDARMSEADATDTAVAVVTLGRRLYAGETLAVPVALSSATGAGLPGATREDFSVAGTGAGAVFSASGVNLGFTFTGSDTGTVRTATLTFTPSAVVDDDTTDDTVTAVLGTDSVLGSETGVGGGALRHASNYEVDLTHVDRALVSLSVSGGGNVTEGGTLTVTATRTKANTSGAALAIPVRLKTADSTAVGADYTLAASISIANNATTGTATFTAVDDNGDEPPETAVLELGTLPAGTWAGPNGEVEITIADNDATTVTLAGADGDVTEGGTKDFTVTLNRGLVSGEILPVTLTFGTGSGTATRGTDYTLACASATGVACTGLNSGTATITFTGPSSGATAASVTLTLTAVAEDPNVVEATGETVDIDLGTLTSTSGTGLGGGAAGTDSLEDFDINDEDLTAPALSTATVNGTTLVLTYNEALDEGSTPAAAAFTVTADGDPRTVSGVAVDGTTVTLTLDTAAAHGETVLVSYALPGTNRIQDVAGNDAVALTGQTVDNNTPDTTAPVLTGAAVTGASLVLTYNEALDGTSTPAAGAFTVTLAGVATTVSGVAVSGTTVTLTLNPAAAHDEAVVVSYARPGSNRIQDSAGNEAAAFASRAVTNNTPDTTAPVLSSATVTGDRLVLTYDEALDESSTPAAGAFAVTVDSAARTVSTVAVDGTAVTLTLGSAVTPGQAVRVSYTLPGSNRIQDEAGNDALALTNRAVTNNTADTTAPVLSSAVVDGAELVLTYNEALDANSRPAAGAFTVTVAGTTRTVSVVAMSGQTVTLTLSSAVAPGQAVRLSYAPPSSNPIRDAAGNNAVALTNRVVTNNTADTTAPVLSGAEVTGVSLVLTYDEALDGTSTPANSAYTVTVAGATRTVDDVTVAGSTVTLTLASAPVPGETVTVSYTVPNANPIRDSAGNAALAFANRAVTNEAVGVIGHVRLGTPSAATIGEGGSSQVSLGVYDDNGNVITGAGDVHVGICFSGTALARLANVRGRAADYKLQVQQSGGAWRDQAAGRYRWTPANPCPDDGSGRVETSRVVVKEGLMQLRVVALPDGREEIDETAILTVGQAAYLEAGVLKGLVEDRTPVTVTVGATTMSGPAASFQIGASGADEGAGTHTVRVELAPAPTSAIAIGYGVSGTARAGLDYAELSGSVQVPANAAHADIQIALLDDNIDEIDETVVLTLHAGAGYTVLGTGTHTLTLSDDDGPPPVVSIKRDADAVTEGGSATFTLKADPKPPAPIQVKVNVVDSGDFALSGQTGARTFTIGTGGTTTFTVGTDDDNIDESDGRITATVTAGTGYTPHGSDASVWVGVNDNDEPPGTPVVSIAGGAAVTEGGNAEFTLTADPKPVSTIQVMVAVTETGSFAESGQIKVHTVNMGRSGTASFTVGTDDDSTDEPQGSIEATVNAGTGYAPHGTDVSASVAVNDNDEPPPLSVALSLLADDKATSVSSGPEGTHRWLRVTMTNANFAKTIEWCVSGGNADYGSGQDYAFVQGNTVLGLTSGCWSETLSANDTQAEMRLRILDDSNDEPAPAETFTVHATVSEDGGQRTATSTAVAYTIRDTDPTSVTLAGSADAIDENGGAKTLTVTLGRALVAGEELRVPLMFGGLAKRGVDYTLACAQAEGVSCWFPNANHPQIRFTGGAGAATAATLTLTSVDDPDDEGAGEMVTVAPGTLGTTGLDGGASKSGSVSFTITDDDLPPPVVTIAAVASPVTEGGQASFTLTADRAPAAALGVNVEVRDAAGADYLAQGDEGARTVTIPANQTALTLTLNTEPDGVDEPDGPVSVTLRAGDGYTAGDPSSAEVTVQDDDDDSALPTLSVFDATGVEGAHVQVTIRLSRPSDEPVTVLISSRESIPVSAKAVDDFMVWTYRGRYGGVTFRPGQTETTRGFLIWPDAHDDGGETFEVYLHRPEGATIADAVAVITIENDDPLPGAWLARFGRTVAEQALEGISDRMAAPRAPGMQGTLAGQALPRAGAGGDAGTEDPEAALALTRIAQGFGTGGFGAGGPGAGSPFGGGLSGGLSGPGAQAQAHSMTGREALLGSRFTLTGETDSTGGTLAFWGRASQGSFDGRERADGADLSLDGTVTTGMLGADYARDKWLVGLALLQSDAKGGYDTRDVECPALPPGAPEGMCEEMKDAGDGSIAASLTAAVPYASLQASERLKLWGAMGHGTGEVTLKEKRGASYSADTSWTMAAAGLRGELLAPSAGPALALTSDALWARTSSDKARGLAASDSDTTRLRLGLEGSWHVALEGGARLVPKLEIGARHDGGDAETGFGVELGGGLEWADPGLGLSLDLSGRTLVAHEDGDLKDRGYAAALAFDPAPATKRGPSLSLRQEFGGQAAGGLDALFQPEPLAERTGSGTAAASRWTLEAAYGFPAFGGRWTGSPQVGFGLATAARDYSLGWRLTPEAANAPDLSFGLKAVRRESDTGEAEHTIGVEITARW